MPAPSPAPRASKARRIAVALLRFGFGALLFGLLLQWLGPEPGTFAKVEWNYRAFGIAALALTLTSAMTAARWKILAEAMGGTSLRYGAYFYALNITRFVGQFTSALAMDLIGRGVALRWAGSERSVGHVFTQVLLERSLDVAIPLLIVGWASVASQLPVDPEASLAGLLLGFALLAIPLQRPGVSFALWGYGKFRRVIGKPLDEDLVAAPVSTKLASAIVALSLLRFGSIVIQFTALAAAGGLILPAIDMSIATAGAGLASVLGLTPGGLGLLEGGWVAGLRWLGAQPELIAVFIVVQRLAVICFFGVASLVSWPFRRG